MNERRVSVLEWALAADREVRVFFRLNLLRLIPKKKNNNVRI